MVDLAGSDPHFRAIDGEDARQNAFNELVRQQGAAGIQLVQVNQGRQGVRSQDGYRSGRCPDLRGLIRSRS